MTSTNYADMVKDLYHHYYNHNISHEEYRAERKIIIDQMDRAINGNNRTANTFGADTDEENTLDDSPE